MNRSNMLKKYIFLSLMLLFSTNCAFGEWVEEPARTVNENYYRLKKALDYYEILQTKDWPTITTSEIKKDYSSPAVPELRERLRLTGDLPSQADSQSERYDDLLVAAVKRFQARHGLKADGILGPKTERELNVSPYERAEEIRRNMQRWAALPVELGKRFIFINIPEYRLDLVENGIPVLTMKIIVGRPDRPTPELTSQLTQVQLNPYWNVPPRIAEKDILPKILKDPHYLETMHIKVVQRRKEEVIDIDASKIDWHEVEKNGLAYDLRQEPGKNNALGLVKFDFPNEYDVFMHDTPAKGLFNKESRIFSSGCIRLEKPFALLAYLLENNPEWDVHRVAEALQSGKLTIIKVKPLPIYIIYATAWVDRHGILNFRHDPYSYNEDPNPDDLAPAAKLDDPFAIPLSFYA